ncbi:MAG: hypothetical protein ACM3S1_14745 [Hyphomicrobiales bacterium]
MAIDGNWKLSMQTPMGNREVDLELTSSGNNLSGAFKGPQGSSAVTGTADGASVNFSTTFTGAMGPMELKFAGNHEGDSISGTVQFGAFGSGPFTANRA